MCGIVGLHSANKAGFFKNDVDALKGMLVTNSLRGIDSTGLMGFDKTNEKNHEVNIVKSVGSPFNLFDWGRAREFFDRMNSRFGTVVGHGRYATKGDVNGENAHPFEEGHITLVHNGGISNFYQLRDFEKHSHVQVDSHLVACLIAEKGAEEVLPRLQGAYTLVWYDSTDGTLHMARNDQRPLFLGENKDTLFFASEVETLAFVNSRYNLQMDEEKFVSLPAYRHYIFEKGSLVPEVRTYAQYVPPSFQSRYRGEDWDEWNVMPPSNLSKRERKALKYLKNNKTNNVTQIDRNKLISSAGIDIAAPCSMEIEDWEDHSTANNIQKLVKGYNPLYPNVEIRCWCNYTDNQLISAGTLKGTVRTILVINPSTTLRGVPFILFLENHSLGQETTRDASLTKGLGYTEDKTWVNLTDTTNDTVISIASHRFDQMGCHNCAFCDQRLTDEEMEKPENLGVYREHGVERLVCTSCMCGWDKNLDSVN